MKKTLSALAAAGLIAAAVPTTATANEIGGGLSWSGNLTFTSDYLFRGFTESDAGPAVQGEFAVEHETGFYLGSWSSSLASGDDGNGLETSVYGGYEVEFYPGLTFDIGIYRYIFPRTESNEDFNEYYVGLGTSFYDFDVELYYSYANDYLKSGDSASIPELFVTYNVPDSDVYLFGNTGYTKWNALRDEFDTNDYWYWEFGAGVEVVGLDFSVMYTDQDLESRRRFAFMVGADF
ncbi:TorF family putative porin [Methylonatrum kenyense]|uniref:TorF family putative porin n=1 Tax=Methylonatrum kenyense TaxID=455253 RepID=UPI0020BDEC19|nr:TorF family putative porin [Methylonatrum kenyense]MCK8515194.1 TorF family putative porin [Methylonatrum kenyense]